MKRFSPITNEAIRHYVYLLVDPRDNTIFYVGEGQKNRVFMHEEHVRKYGASTDKEKRIQDIILSGNEVLKYIVRVNLSKEEAFVVESVIINLLGTSEMGDLSFDVKLTNIQCGHGMKKNGLMLVDEVESLYGAKPLNMKDVKHNILCVNINKLYDTTKDLYEATRKSWVVNKVRANKCDFVASEYQGVIKALYKVDSNGWYARPSEPNRLQFDGTQVTDEKILKLYINKRIEKRGSAKRPSRNPIRYIIKNRKD